MSGDENDFLTGMMAQSAPAASAPEADVPESDAPESGEVQASEPVAAAPVVEPVVAPPAPPEEKTVPLAVLMAQKDDFKKKLAERERELEELRNKAKPAPQTVNFYDNPEEHLNQRFQEIEARATARTYAALEAVEKEAHPDFDEVAAEVIAAAQQHPTLVNQIMQAANPAREMYKVGQKLREFQKMQDPEAYRAQMAAEIRAQVLAELGERGAQAGREAAARAAKAAGIPPDISTRTNAPPKSGVTVTNPVNALFPKH
jgi:hypothetical protein